MRRWARIGLASAALAVGLYGASAFTPMATVARASVVRALSLAEMVKESTVIVLGEVGERQARRGPKQLIVTDVSVEIQEALKGGVRPGESLVVTVMGGALDGVALQVPGEASLPQGERMLLFLRRSMPSGDLRVVGMAQGALGLEQAQSGWMVLPTPGHAALVLPNNEGSLEAAPPAVAEKVPLEQLLSRIATLVRAEGASR